MTRVQVPLYMLPCRTSISRTVNFLRPPFAHILLFSLCTNQYIIAFLRSLYSLHYRSYFMHYVYSFVCVSVTSIIQNLLLLCCNLLSSLYWAFNVRPVCYEMCAYLMYYSLFLRYLLFSNLFILIRLLINCYITTFAYIDDILCYLHKKLTKPMFVHNNYSIYYFFYGNLEPSVCVLNTVCVWTIIFSYTEGNV